MGRKLARESSCQSSVRMLQPPLVAGGYRVVRHLRAKGVAPCHECKNPQENLGKSDQGIGGRVPPISPSQTPSRRSGIVVPEDLAIVLPAARHHRRTNLTKANPVAPALAIQNKLLSVALDVEGRAVEVRTRQRASNFKFFPYDQRLLGSVNPQPDDAS